MPITPAYTPIPDTDIDGESPITTSLMTALRDNVAAAFAKGVGAPQLAADYVTAAMIAPNAVQQSALGFGGPTVEVSRALLAGIPASAVIFTLDASYDDFIIDLSGVLPSISNTQLQLHFSNDAGVSFFTSYNYTRWDADSTSSVTSAASIAITGLVAGGGANKGVSGTVRIITPSHMGEYPSLFSDVAHTNGNTFAMAKCAGLVDADTAVNRVRLSFSSGGISYGSIRLLGRIRGEDV